MGNVATNRQRILQKQGLSEGVLLTCHQIHSAKAVTVKEPWSEKNGPKVDGMATKIPSITLGVLTADCAPVLFADSVSSVIGAAHAGWQGALNGVLEATLAEMVALGSALKNIKAAIGPCIGRESYEIGPEFRDLFIREGSKNEQFFVSSKNKGHHMFDLTSYIENRLLNIGVSKISKAGHDTCSDETNFFSHRRAVLRGEVDYGREISTITLLK